MQTNTCVMFQGGQNELAEKENDEIKDFGKGICVMQTKLNR